MTPTAIKLQLRSDMLQALSAAIERGVEGGLSVNELADDIAQFAMEVRSARPVDDDV